MNTIVILVPTISYFLYDMPFFVKATRSFPEVTSSFNSLYCVKHLTQYLTRFKTAIITAGVRIMISNIYDPPFIIRHY
jgi:hypothetical protein